MSGFNFTEIFKLKAMLEKAGIPFVFRRLYDGYQIVYPTDADGEWICDAVIHFGSYGYARGLLEIMGLVDVEEVGDDVEGYLTAEEVFGRIEKHYRRKKMLKAKTVTRLSRTSRTVDEGENEFS